jgi:[ribosomal protein S5]-alanine N-acetyltransferase
MIPQRDIKGDRIRISLFREQDVSDKYLGWLTDEKINKYLEVRFKVYSENLAVEYIRNCINSSNVYFLKVEAIGFGLIGTCTITHNQDHKTADIGLMIGETSLHNQGFGSEVIRLLTQFCCDDLGVRKVTAGLYATNKGSFKAFLKNGFSIEGRLASQVLLDGMPEDIYRLAYFCNCV